MNHEYGSAFKHAQAALGEGKFIEAAKQFDEATSHANGAVPHLIAERLAIICARLAGTGPGPASSFGTVKRMLEPDPNKERPVLSARVDQAVAKALLGAHDKDPHGDHASALIKSVQDVPLKRSLELLETEKHTLEERNVHWEAHRLATLKLEIARTEAVIGWLELATGNRLKARHWLERADDGLSGYGSDEEELSNLIRYMEAMKHSYRAQYFDRAEHLIKSTGQTDLYRTLELLDLNQAFSR